MLNKLAFALSALTMAGGVSSSSTVTVDDLMKLRSIIDLKISPDGRQVAYVVSTPSVERNGHEGALFVVSTGGGAPTPLARGAVLTQSPTLRWSPDGRAISFLAIAGGRAQVTTVNPANPAEVSKTLTSAAASVVTYEWAPDGKRIAYVSPAALTGEETRQQQDSSAVTHVGAPDRPVPLWVQAIGGAAPVQASWEWQIVDSLSWMPSSAEIVFSASGRSGFMGPYFTRLYAVRLADLAVRQFVDRPGMNMKPQVSPDGKQVAFISTNHRLEIMAPRSLTVVSLLGGEASTPRTYGLDDAWVNEFVWSADSASIYLQANDGTFASHEHMFEQPIMRVQIADGHAETVVAGPMVNYSLSLSADGKQLAYRSVTSRTMGDVVVMDLATRRATTLTEVNPELRNLTLGELKPIKWRSFDGFEIWGLLLTPPGTSSPAPRLPLVVYIHGGPGGGVTYGIFPQFMHIRGQVDPYPSEAMASAGMAILFPMPRGGAGYGEAGQRAIVNAWGETDYKDIMAGVDSLVAQGIANPDRLGVMGASYGGYMTNWIVTQTSRFKAASSGASLSDLADMYYTSEGGDFVAEYFGKPWANRESYTAHSPITFAKNVTTPLLIQHGERDPRVPVAQAWMFYRALKAMGKTVELDIHPRGGHVLAEPAQERAAMQRNLDWFTKYLIEGKKEVKWFREDAPLDSETTQRVARPFVIQFPQGTDLKHAIVSSFVRGPFGGAGRPPSCTTGSETIQTESECEIGTVIDGKAAVALKAFVLLPGSAVEIIRVDSLASHPGRVLIQPRPLGRVRLTGRIEPLPSGQSLAGATIHVTYMADWQCELFELMDCLLGYNDIGVTAQVNADSTFSVDVPDFANDPALGRYRKGTFRISIDDRRAAGYRMDGDNPWGDMMIPVASSYSPVVLRPVKRQ
ncbi:MAG TPA: S9 family peptidase [Vicinamibacterales bacterium]|nr:S9 family peptidase [Vicinamibacterales bacterium]